MLSCITYNNRVGNTLSWIWSGQCRKMTIKHDGSPKTCFVLCFSRILHFFLSFAVKSFFSIILNTSTTYPCFSSCIASIFSWISTLLPAISAVCCTSQSCQALILDLLHSLDDLLVPNSTWQGNCPLHPVGMPHGPSLGHTEV